MDNMIATLTSRDVTKIIAQIEPTFRKMPHLPKGLVDFFVMITPWLAGIGGVLGIFAGLSLISSGLTGSTPGMMAFGISPLYFLLTGVLQLIMAGILLLAFKPLQTKQKTGWILLFWTMVLSLLQTVVAIVFSFTPAFSLLGTALGVFIGLYILFEMKSAYKG